ncbi:hypothetical protein VPH35_084691 [Triticum aestivum]
MHQTFPPTHTPIRSLRSAPRNPLPAAFHGRAPRLLRPHTLVTGAARTATPAAGLSAIRDGRSQHGAWSLWIWIWILFWYCYWVLLLHLLPANECQGCRSSPTCGI